MLEHNFIENQLVILTKQTLDIFLRQDNPSELIALYTFYYYTAKWQGTNQPKCTTSYVANGLHWSENKVRKVKKQLIEFGLIEDIQVRDLFNKITGHYVKMNYIFKKETLEKIGNEKHKKSHPNDFKQGGENGLKSRVERKSHPNDFLQGGNSYSMESEGTNALSTNNLNALSSNNKNALSSVNNKNINENINEHFEKLWKMLPSTKYDRKSQVKPKRKKELYKIEPERVEKAINLYLKIQDPKYYYRKDNFFNEIIDNYLDKNETDFKETFFNENIDNYLNQNEEPENWWDKTT